MALADPETTRRYKREYARRRYAQNAEALRERSRRDYAANREARKAAARARSRKRAAYRLGAKPFCKRGHALIEGNIDAERRCLICRRAAGRRASLKRYYADLEHSRAKARNRVMGIVGDLNVAYAGFVRRDPCSYCAGRSTEADHIEPIAAGGRGVWENLTGACRSCNAAKGDRPLLTYLLTRKAVLA